MELCAVCREPTDSAEGSSDCSFCFANYYSEVPSANGSAALNCAACPGSATCAPNTTLATLNLTRNHWRLSPRSRQITACEQGAEGSACAGGTSSGIEGDGYCLPGHRGPRCQICDQSARKQFFNVRRGICSDCPPLDLSFPLIGIVSVVALLLSGVLYWIARSGSHSSHCMAVVTLSMNRVWRRIKDLALMAKLKILIVYLQIVLDVPETYGVELPPTYRRIMRDALAWIDLDWTRLVVPGECLSGGFDGRLLLRGLVPLGAAVALFLANTVLVMTSQARTVAGNEYGVLMRALLLSLPLILFASFCLTPGVSAGIFRAWSCDEYVADDSGDPVVTEAFLSADLRVRCGSERHRHIQTLATAFVFLWPVFWPLCYIILLLICRHSIVGQQRTALQQATRFLHQDYRIWWWEPLLLIQRLTVTGFVRLFDMNDSLRLFVGLLIVQAYCLLLAIVRPYRRRAVGGLAVCALCPQPAGCLLVLMRVLALYSPRSIGCTGVRR